MFVDDRANKKAAGRGRDTLVLKVLSDALMALRERERSRPGRGK
jgi:hypothetical protein